MKLNDLKAVYENASSTVSSRARELSFAGIAIIWIFVQFKEDGAIGIDGTLYWALFLLIAALSFDLLQYIYTSIFYYYYFRSLENRGFKSDDEVKSKVQYNYVSWAFFGLKVIGVIIAYICIFTQLTRLFIIDN